MEYILDNSKFKLSYKELKELYVKYSSMCEEDFSKNIANVLHLVCIIGYLKEIDSSLLLCDSCLIHELSHILTETETVLSISEIQTLFINQMRLD
jgi:hypothetical protein